MCANYKTTQLLPLRQHFGLPLDPADDDGLSELYPGKVAPFVRLSRETGQMECKRGGFGMMPSWAKPVLYRKTYNARTESVAKKPSFRSAWKNAQHCIIPAEWIYEPKWQGKISTRWKIAHRAGRIVGIAGLWEWRPGKDESERAGLFSFTMLTVNADDHSLMKHFHRPEKEKRMVVFLEPQQYDAWLRASPADSMSFLNQYPAEQLVAEPAPLPPKAPGEREDIAA